jgi:hypothetical protein
MTAIALRLKKSMENEKSWLYNAPDQRPAKPENTKSFCGAGALERLVRQGFRVGYRATQAFYFLLNQWPA